MINYFEGTNNLDFKSKNILEDISLRTKEILTQLKAKMPSTIIILLGVLPRGDLKGIRAKNINKLYLKLADNNTLLVRHVVIVCYI